MINPLVIVVGLLCGAVVFALAFYIESVRLKAKLGEKDTLIATMYRDNEALHRALAERMRRSDTDLTMVSDGGATRVLRRDAA